MSYDVILLAAGSGRRMQADRNKVLLEINDRPIFDYSLKLFLADSDCKQVFLVGKANERTLFEAYLSERVRFVVGGTERQDSVAAALEMSQSPQVMVHDGARPFVTEGLVAELKTKQNAIPYLPLKDTIKLVNDGQIKSTLPRDQLIAVQTPQYFERQVLQLAHNEARLQGFLGTDDASLVEQFLPNLSIELVLGNENNIKITTPDDLAYARYLVERIKNDLSN